MAELLKRLRPGRRLGWLPDEPDERDHDFAALGFATSSDTEVRLLPVFREPSFIVNQGRSSTCVANAFQGGIAVRDFVKDVKRSRASRLFMYWNSRNYHHAQKVDAGTHLRYCAKGLTRLGAPDEEIWPFDIGIVSSKVNKQPSWLAYNRAHSRRGGTYHRIFDSGSDRLTAVKAALKAGYPVAFGTRVPKSFLANEGPNTINRPSGGEADPIAGGHAMLIIGYQHNPLYGDVFRVMNSWGTQWRDNGLFWMTGEWLAWDMTSDLWIIVDGRPA